MVDYVIAYLIRSSNLQLSAYSQQLLADLDDSRPFSLPTRRPKSQRIGLLFATHDLYRRRLSKHPVRKSSTF